LRPAKPERTPPTNTVSRRKKNQGFDNATSAEIVRLRRGFGEHQQKGRRLAPFLLMVKLRKASAKEVRVTSRPAPRKPAARAIDPAAR
jgi:hypothetical protein